MLRKFSVLILLSCFVGVASAQQLQLADVLPPDPTVRTGTLPNGMKYYVKKNIEPAHRMELRLALKAGSILEDDDQQGLAHFCEHMQFNGLKHFPKADLVNFLEATGVRFGAHLNASTGFDQTVYMLQLPTDSQSVVDKGLLVMQDWAGGATLDSDEIDKERGVVLEEWRLGRGAGERIQNVQLPVEYKGSHYAERLPIGKPDIIEHAPYSSLRRFYHTWYRPDLMAIIAVGDFDVDQMVSQIKSRFGSIPKGTNEKPRTEYTVPMHTDLRVSVASDSELQTNIAQIIYQRPEEKDRTVGDYRHDLAEQLYVGMLNNRIQELQRKSSSPFVYGGVNNGRDLGKMSEFAMFVALKPDNILGGIKASMEELVRVREHGFTKSEFEREKKDLVRGFEQSYTERDKTDSRRFVNEYVSNFLQDEPYPGIAYELSLVHKYVPEISLDQVNALTATLMTNAGPVVLVACQKSKKTAIPSETEVRSLYQIVSSESLAGYNDSVSTAPLMPTKPTPGQIVDEHTFADMGITEWHLSNGVKVVIKPTDFKNDEVLFSASAPGGTSLASDNDALAANFAAEIVGQSGVSTFDETSLEKVLAGKVVSLSPSISQLSQGFDGRASVQDLPTLFQLVYLYAVEPRVDRDAYSAQMQKLEAFLKNRDVSPETAYGDTLTVTMTQYNPRFRPLSEDRLKEVSLDKIDNFYHERFSNFNGFTFFFVGNVDLKTLRPLVETYIASLPSKGQKTWFRDLGVRPPTGVITKSVYKGVEPKSRVTIILTGPFDYTPQNRFKIQEMSEVLSIKLRETLREDKGGVYGVGVRATPIHYPEPRYQLSISFACSPDRVDELVGAVMEKLDTMTTKAPQEIYVKKVTEIAKKELEVNLKKNNYWMSALEQAYLNDEDLRVIINDRSKYIDSLTPKDILEAGKTYCSKKNMVEVVLYPEKK